jgi:dipeptidyl aminopeptidase/acylaminoacyl peptidase
LWVAIDLSGLADAQARDEGEPATNASLTGGVGRCSCQRSSGGRFVARIGRWSGALVAAWSLAWAFEARAEAERAPAASPAKPPVEAFGKLPQVSDPTLSPSGRRIAFIATRPKGRTLIVAEGAKPLFNVVLVEQAAKGAKAQKDAKVSEVEWADENHVLVSVTATSEAGLGFRASKYELKHTVAINLVTGKSIWIFDHNDEILQSVGAEYGFATKAGKVYGYFAGQPIDVRTGLKNSLNLYRVDLDTGRAYVEAEGPDFNRTWLLGRGGTILAYTDYDETSQTWRLHDGKTGAVLARNKNPFDSASIDGQGRTPGTILYDTPDKDGGAEYYETSLTKGATPIRVFEGQGPGWFLHDPRTGLLAGRVTEGDYPDTTYFDPLTEARWRATKKAFPNLNVQLVSRDDAFDTLIVETDGDGDSGTYWTVDLKSGKAEPFAAIYPDIPDTAVGSRRMISYKAADGLEIHGVLTLPPGRTPKNLPVIVLPHGGPEARDDLAYDWLSGALAARGYAVFQPNFRGSSGYGVDFVNAGNGQWGRKMQTDISDGLADLVAKGIVDPKRACTLGWSYGGYAALAGVTLQHGLYRCAVSIAGISDLRAMLADEAQRNDEDSTSVRVWKARMGVRSLGDGALRLISPAEQAAKADAPILLIHGKDDTVVPIEQSRIMERALKRAGKSVTFVQIEGEDHNMSREPTRVAMLKAAVAFVELYNPAD